MAWKMSRFKPLDLGVSLFGASKKYGYHPTPEILSMGGGFSSL